MIAVGDFVELVAVHPNHDRYLQTLLGYAGLIIKAQRKDGAVRVRFADSRESEYTILPQYLKVIK